MESAVHKMEFPNPCCQCGFCCIAESCISAQAAFGIKKTDPCPALHFHGDVAICSLPGIPFGDGCCISARVFKYGVESQYADLPDAGKIGFVRTLRGS